MVIERSPYVFIIVPFTACNFFAGSMTTLANLFLGYILHPAPVSNRKDNPECLSWSLGLKSALPEEVLQMESTDCLTNVSRYFCASGLV